MAEEVIPDELDITDEMIAERRTEEPGQTPEDMTPWQRPITGSIDVLNLWAGRLTCLLIIPLIAIQVFEVTSSSLFGILTGWGMNDLARSLGLGPTLWVYDVSRMTGGIIFMAGAGYALMRGVHIRADFLYRNWTPKTQATVDASLYLLFYFPAMLFFFWSSLGYAVESFGANLLDPSTWSKALNPNGWHEASDSTWAPWVWPCRIFMPIGAFLLLLQGLPELFRCFYKMGKERETKFVRFLPFYVILLAMVFAATFFGDYVPFDDWWGSFVSTTGLFSYSGPTIGMLLIAVMLFSIFVGFPIAFTLIFLGFTFGTWGIGSYKTSYLESLQFNSTMWNDQLFAVPLFVFMGIMMEQAGLMERLFTAVQLMMSRTRGALFIAVLFVSTIFAAATGIVGASVTILGIMAARTMNKSGYNVRLAAGTITAGGTLGILIPPSIMLIVMGPVLEVPVTDLFRAAIIPGILLAALYMAYALIRCWIDPSMGPILPEDEQPKTSIYYSLEVSWVAASLGILVWLIIKGATGGLSFFPLAGILIPLAWIGIMYATYNWTRNHNISGQLVEIVSLIISVALLILLILDFGVSGWNSLMEGQILTGVLYILIPLAWLVLMTVIFNKKRISEPGRFYFSDLWYEFFMGLVPPTILIAFALGSILMGWATPAQASGCGALGAILLSLGYRKLTKKKFYDALIKTLEINVLIMFLVAASNFFGAVFSILGTPTYLTGLLLSMDMSTTMMLLFIMALVFLLGWPLEWVPIVVIIVPILVPILVQLDVNLVWFAILVAVNLQTAWLSPPVALSAYFLKGVVPEWDLKDIYFGMMQFMCIQVIGLILIFMFPGFALWLPDYLSNAGSAGFFSYSGYP